MESSRQLHNSVDKEIRFTESNVFSKSVHSRLYESFHLQNSSALSQDRQYDSQYKHGFPKLYSFDTSVQNRSGISLDDKNKFSFRNQNSRVVQENLLQENLFLKSEVTRLTSLLQTQRRTSISRSEFQRQTLLVSSHYTEIIRLQGLLEAERRNNNSRSEIQRLSALLSSRQTEIRRLQQRIAFLERQPVQPQSNEWQLKFNESQTIISQLNVKITNLTQQINQYSSDYNIKISQYTARISQLENARSVPKTDPQVGILQSRIERYQTQIEQLNYQIQQYEVQISQYERKFSQYESQITTLQQTNWKLEERSEKPQTSVTPVPAPVVDNQKWVVSEGKLNFRIIILLEQINRLRQKEAELSTKAEQLHAYLLKAQNYIQQIQVQLQRNNLKQNIPAHIVEKVTRIEQQNSRYTLLIQELQTRLASFTSTGIPEDDHYAKLGQRDLRIIILLEQINRLNQRVLEIRSYLQKAEDYIEQLQEGLKNQQGIIPAEIQNQLIYLNEQNHRLNVIIQNYITEIRTLKISITQLETRTTAINTQVKTQYKIPPEIQTKIAFLAQENERLNKLIIELNNRPARVQTKTEYKTEIKTEFKIPPEIQTRLAFLAQENQRLNKLIVELQNRPVKVQTRIVEQKGNNEQLEGNYAKLLLRSIILLQEINRLNHTLKEVTSFLLNAENYIEEIQIRMRQTTHTTTQTHRVDTKVEYRIPEQIEAELAKFTLRTIFLLEEINRLNHLVKEVQGYLINAQSYIEQCQIRISEFSSQTKTIQFGISPQIEARIAFLAQENQRLNKLVIDWQNRPARIQTRIQQKIQFKTSPQIEARIALLASENERLKADLSRLSSTQTSTTQDSHLIAEYGRLQLRSLILLEQINRLNFLTEQLRQHLINAENYIFEIENRSPQVGGISPQIESKIAFLAQQNERLKLEINKITITYEQQINHYKTEISSYTTQITNFVTQINNYKTQINNYNVQITKLESRSSVSSGELTPEIKAKIAFLTSEVERLSKISSQTYNEQLISDAEGKWGSQHLKTIILLEQINRLNTKLSTVDGQRKEVIQQLIVAQTYIQQLQARYTQLQLSTKQSSITTTTVQGSNSAIQELNVQLIELENKNKFDVAERNLRIIFLLEEINRLNNKEKQLIASLGGSTRSISSNQEIIDLRRQKEECERELQQVLNHLRQAEEYIGELLRQNQGFAKQRDELISQLNNLQHRR